MRAYVTHGDTQNSESSEAFVGLGFVVALAGLYKLVVPPGIDVLTRRLATTALLLIGVGQDREVLCGRMSTYTPATLH